MSVRRVMGTEVEYGISVQGQPSANPMVASSQIVNAYASSTAKARRARWDFEEESPLRDARGFDMARQIADPSQLTDEDLGLANVILTNGARLYVDHAHPEYSSPEVTTPLDVVRWEKAGEQVMLDASRMAAQVPGSAPIVLYKNNTDNKGASYGAHENYLMRRSTPFAEIVRHLTPFFVSPPGRHRRRPRRHRPGRPRTRRASRSASAPTTSRSRSASRRRSSGRSSTPATSRTPTRRSTAASTSSSATPTSPRSRSTSSPAPPSLVLAMIEDGFIDRDLSVEGAVAALRDGLARPDAAAPRHAARRAPAHRRTAAAGVPRPGPQVRRGPLRRRRRRADRRRPRALGVGADPARAGPDGVRDELDWVAKLKLLNQYRDRDDLDWDDAKLHLIDLQYADIRPDKGLYHRLAAAGPDRAAARRRHHRGVRAVPRLRPRQRIADARVRADHAVDRRASR